MKYLSYVLFVFPLVLLLLIFQNCGNSSSNISELSKIMGLIALTSPTATSSSTSRGVRGDKVLFSGGAEELKPMKEMVQEMEELREKNPNEAVKMVGNPIEEKTVTNALCYGPSLTEDSTGKDVPRPPKDLGLFYETASDTDSTACAVAELNALIAGVPQYVNKFIALQAVMVSSGGQSGKKPPKSGESVDLTSDMPDAQGIDFSSVKVEGKTDSNGKEAYQTTMTYHKEGTREENDVTIYHVPLNEENTNFKGLFKAVIPKPDNNYIGISVVYEKNGDLVSLSMRTCMNRTTVSSKDFFDAASGLIDFTKPACGQEGNYMIAMFNTSDNSGLAHYAWQAGLDGEPPPGPGLRWSRGDNASRVFEIKAPSSGNGVAYFGFGKDLKDISSSSMPWIEGMICDWLAHIGEIQVSGKAQKQTFDVTTKEPVESKIDYAPNEACFCDGLDSRCGSAGFTISNAEEGATFLEGNRKVDSFSLADAPKATIESDVPNVTEPTFTLPSSE